MAKTLAPLYDAAHVTTLLRLTTEGPPPSPVEGYLTFFDPGWSILQLRDHVKDRGIFHAQNWCVAQAFAQATEKPQYRHLRMTAVKDSFGKTYTDQCKLLAPEDEVPSARVVVMGTVLHFLTFGERLFPNHWVRCADTPSDRFRVRVGYFDDFGLGISDYWGDVPYDYFGLAASRKS